ncbi:alpha/beta fold hydrolase [Microbacterium sp. CIAB417]|uniref:alpha/beta fold hydrolase n=1 Tax=Microbacterium sp. CIAB417 TaxID=2860287 RepID=UPI001FADE7B6|nr:alpha/beta hydrolase [Microbacterium sp. CIAB417]
MPVERGTLHTNDGVSLAYLDTGGAGVPLVLLHGWGQTSAMFGPLIERMRPGRRIVTFDMRGHGVSDKPTRGYRIARLAADLRDVLAARGVTRADLLGWSMGASVLWSYSELFGTGSIRKLVLVDQPAAVVAVPWMTEPEQQEAGSILPVDGLVALADGIHNDETGAVLRGFVRSMFSGPVDDDLWQFVAEEIARTPRHAAVPLLFDHGAQDWRDVLPRIDVPALVIGCDGSHVAPDSQRHVAALLPNGHVHVFTRDVASSHFPFLQNPDAFSKVVAGFLD